MHCIEPEDLALGTVERHHTEDESWHALENVTQDLSTENCKLREFDVRPAICNVESPFDGVEGEKPYHVPACVNPLNKGKLLILGAPYEGTYQLFTPVDFVEFAKSCFNEAGLDNSIAFTTSMFAGRRQSIAKAVPEANFKDSHGHEIKTYFNLLNSLDSSWPVFGNISEIRPVCANTATANIREGGASARHTPEGLAKFIRNFPKLFAQALKEHKGSANDYLKMSDIPMTVDEAKYFFFSLVSSEGKEAASTRAFTVVTENLLPLFKRGRGCYGKAACDIYCAVTEHYTHRGTLESNAPGGSADNYKRKAKEMLLSAKLPAYIENGKKLFMNMGK